MLASLYLCLLIYNTLLISRYKLFHINLFRNIYFGVPLKTCTFLEKTAITANVVIQVKQWRTVTIFSCAAQEQICTGANLLSDNRLIKQNEGHCKKSIISIGDNSILVYFKIYSSLENNLFQQGKKLFHPEKIQFNSEKILFYLENDPDSISLTILTWPPDPVSYLYSINILQNLLQHVNPRYIPAGVKSQQRKKNNIPISQSMYFI